MATTQTITRDAQYFIYRAYRLLRKISSEDTLESTEETAALETLQDMMKGWENGDDPMHKKITISVPLVAGQGMYELNTLARVRDVHQVQMERGVNSFGMPMTVINKREYQDNPVKEQNGFPSQYCFDRSPSSMIVSEPATDVSADAAKLYLWPRPDATVAGNTLTIKASVPYAVPTLLTDPLDVPQEWYNALAYCLAAELWQEIGGNQNVIPKAAELWQDVLEADRPAFLDVVRADV